MKQDDWNQFREKLLEDPETREAYQARRPAYAFAVQLAELRRQKGLSQAALAKQAGMTQSEVARIETAEASPTFDTMARLLAAAGADLDIKFRDTDGKLVRLPMVLEGAQLAPRSRRGRTAGKGRGQSAHPAGA